MICKKYEYRVLNDLPLIESTDSPKSLEETLTELSEEGWEPVTMVEGYVSTVAGRRAPAKGLLLRRSR